MKKLFAMTAVIAGLLAAVFSGTRSAYAAGSIPINIAGFPDPCFREYVIENFDTNRDNKLSEQEISRITRVSLESPEIKNLAGIEYFTSLEELDLANSDVSSLNLSQNTALIKLVCNNNDSLISLDLRKNKILSDLDCQGNDKLETVCLLYHQKKDFISVPYEPKDAEYLKSFPGTATYEEIKEYILKKEVYKGIKIPGKADYPTMATLNRSFEFPQNGKKIRKKYTKEAHLCGMT
ncbi:MAG: hypothetical protein IKR59_07355 [Lachnospiraceae bacterium]|nr:hypothetical protein [Lachnospiraceae bacterium]